MSKRTYQVVYALAVLLIVDNNVRQEPTDEADAQLTESIRQHGILQPLGVRPAGDKWRLVWGFRRLRCGLAAGKTEFPVVVLPENMTEGEFVTLQMIENVKRSDLNAYDMFQGCARLQEAHPGVPLQDLAEKLSISPPMLTMWLSPSKLVPEWLDALKAGKVGISDCYPASKLPPEQQPGMLAFRLGGATRDQLVKAVKEASQPGKPPATKLARVSIPLSTGTRVVVSGPEMTLEDLISALASALEAARKASKDSLDVRTAEKVWRDKAKAV